MDNDDRDERDLNGKRVGTRIAPIAAAGILLSALGLATANAADLSGDCCADLEERVAELEATAVRKGNRKVALALTGIVSEMILFWDDGVNNDVYVVEDPGPDYSFRLIGSATIRPGLSAGSLIEVEALTASGSSVDARIDGADNENRDGLITATRVSFNLRHDRLGKLTVGRDRTANDDILRSNLAQNPIASSTPDLAGSFQLVSPPGAAGCNGAACRTSLDWSVIAPDLDTNYADLVRYDTPSLYGLVISAAWGEDDVSGLTIRYKKQWNSVRFIGGVGYQWFTDETEESIDYDEAVPVLSIDTIDCPDDLKQATCVAERVDQETLNASGSIMHDPSGLYLTAAVARRSFGKSNGISELRATVFTAPVTGLEPRPADMWYLQSGVKRRWLLPSIGATTLYGEYQRFNDFGVRESAESLGLSQEDDNGNDVLISEVTGTRADIWGLGVVQDIDAAAMKLYAGLRVWSPDVRAVQTDDRFNVTFDGKVPLEDFYTVAAGGQINF